MNEDRRHDDERLVRMENSINEMAVVLAGLRVEVHSISERMDRSDAYDIRNNDNLANQLHKMQGEIDSVKGASKVNGVAGGAGAGGIITSIYFAVEYIKEFIVRGGS